MQGWDFPAPLSSSDPQIVRVTMRQIKMSLFNDMLLWGSMFVNAAFSKGAIARYLYVALFITFNGNN